MFAIVLLFLFDWVRLSFNAYFGCSFSKLTDGLLTTILFALICIIVWLVDPKQLIIFTNRLSLFLVLVIYYFFIFLLLLTPPATKNCQYQQNSLAFIDMPEKCIVCHLTNIFSCRMRQILVSIVLIELIELLLSVNHVFDRRQLYSHKRYRTLLIKQLQNPFNSKQMFSSILPPIPHNTRSKLICHHPRNLPNRNFLKQCLK